MNMLQQNRFHTLALMSSWQYFTIMLSCPCILKYAYATAVEDEFLFPFTFTDLHNKMVFKQKCISHISLPSFYSMYIMQQ